MEEKTTKNKTGMSTASYLDQFESPEWMIHKLGRFDLSCDGSFQFRIAGFLESDSWKEVVDEGQKERLVLVDELRQVHVSKNAHDNCRLGVVRSQTLVGSESTKHRQNVAQTEVVMNLHKQTNVLTTTLSAQASLLHTQCSDSSTPNLVLRL